jgi:hypothetical protein
MADKKGDKKSSPAPVIHPAKPPIVLFFIATILSAFVVTFRGFLSRHPGLQLFLETLWLFLQGKATSEELIATTGMPGISSAIFGFKVFSFLLSAFLIFLIISTYRKYKETDKKIREPLQPPKDIVYGVQPNAGEIVNPKWTKVLEHINSANQSDWKLAILEADIMLGEMLDRMGYHGATIADKLKSIESSDFTNLQAAWDAHKVRNAIAHEGSDFAITKPEAERVIKLFKKVFEEFQYI